MKNYNYIANILMAGTEAESVGNVGKQTQATITSRRTAARAS